MDEPETGPQGYRLVLLSIVDAIDSPCIPRSLPGRQLGDSIPPDRLGRWGADKYLRGDLIEGAGSGFHNQGAGRRGLHDARQKEKGDGGSS